MPRQASEIIAILIEDHEKVLRLFTQFQKIRGHADDNARRTLVETACTELVIHAQVEEEFLYPALRDAFDEADLIDEAEVEHTLTRQLIREIETMQPGDHLYDAKFTVLGEYVRHHIEEEQNRIFPLMALAQLESDTLAQDIRHRRHELRSEFGLPDHGYDEDEIFQIHTQRAFPHPHH